MARGYSLYNSKGQVVTDSEGLTRVWYTKAQAKKDAEEIEEMIETKLHVSKGIVGRIGPEGRIEVG